LLYKLSKVNILIMNLVLVFVIAFVIIIFMALPIGVNIPDRIEKGHASSAPDNPMIGMKIIITGLLSGILTFIYWYIIQS
jgi:predicted secreted protein